MSFPCPGKLIYRGVNIEEIVEEAYRNDRFVFEEVIWLLLFGSLPTQSQLDEFCELLAEHRALPDGFMDTMNGPLAQRDEQDAALRAGPVFLRRARRGSEP